ncbi:MAG: WYL domain-containing transcriptional regulator [Abditibacteriota bacterium]|nr:WYL domain-containing transcriptional regulator [Abditibacteriota bacterium]
MADNNKKRIRLLKIYEYLKSDSDDNSMLTTEDLLNRLAEDGIECDRRTLYKDIKFLNECGYEIHADNCGHKKAYYVIDRLFDVSELKILVDAVHGAGFITRKLSKELAKKLSSLAGPSHSEDLNKNARRPAKKHSNESVYYNVGALDEAIRTNKKASFRYFDLDSQGKKKYRKNGEHYVVEPISLLFSDDNYYLIAYNPKYDSENNYRIDRMDDASICNESISKKAMQLKENGASASTLFGMYNGPVKKIDLIFDESLLNVIFDKFGEGIQVVHYEGKPCVTVEVAVSPAFWGWIFTFCGKMRIRGPEEVIKEYKAFAKKALNI